MKLKLSVLTLILIITSSCRASKNVIYFQGIDQVTPELIQQMSQQYKTLIGPDDMLNITVTAWDPTVAVPFNPPMVAYAQEGDQPVNTTQTLYSYLVDKEGYINFPVLGRIKAEGLTRQELGNFLEKEISRYIKDPLVNVQISNFKIIMMGEVNRTGSITIRNDRVSIIDAIGYAGDLTINANRKNILLIRENKEDKIFTRLDITDPAIFASPYFYLKQNDVIYVEPNKAKQKNANYSQAQQYQLSVYSTILSSISIIASSASTIIAISKTSNSNSNSGSSSDR